MHLCVHIKKKEEEMCVVLPGVLQLYEAQRSFNTGVFMAELMSPREQSGIPEPVHVCVYV